jgi:dihydropteroate synthase
MSVKIMAIINTSPDSFSGDGVLVSDSKALEGHIQKAIDEGADILDIGGQSTRPGAEIIDIDEEINRVVPTITLARQLTNKPISVDTFKPKVAKAALKAGATIINDITGFQNPEMIEVVKNAGCQVVIMHMRGTPQTMSSLTDYPNGVVSETKHFLLTQTKKLIEAGVKKENIILDPGIGFAKTAMQSFELTKQLDEFADSGYRVLYGASNKSFLGKALGKNGEVAPVEERVTATAVVQSYAMMHGANILRVHDVKAAVQERTIVEALDGKEITL